MAIWTIWLIIAGIFMILEIATTGFLVFWMGIGALLSMAYSFIFPGQILVQIMIFAISSIILILLTKKITDKIKPKPTATNVYSVIGKEGIVIQEINNEQATGQVKVDGDIWSAKAEEFTEIIPKDSVVQILRIEGVRIVVKKSLRPVNVTGNSN